MGGLITLPVALPANITSVLYVQMRMIACLAYMGGYDTTSDQVVKQVGVQFGVKFTTAMVRKIPGSVLSKINQKVGFRLLTKFGTKGLINIGKAIPIIGGVISGGFDFAETKLIADRAFKMFILNDFSRSGKDATSAGNDIVEVDESDFEVEEVENEE